MQRAADGRTRADHWFSATVSELAEALSTTLLLESTPVGVRIVRSAAVFDASPLPRPRTATHYCSAVRAAAEGTSLKLCADDICCNTAPKTLGMQRGFSDAEFVESYVDCGLYESTAHAEEALASVVTLDDVAGVIVGPLDSFTHECPDVVIVATAPYGAMRLTQAVTFAGERIRSESIGMHGVCSESTAAPHATGQVCTSFMCSGARHLSEWDEGVLSAGIPFGMLPSIIGALTRTAERYESDGRKAEMRAACDTPSTQTSPLATEIRDLSAGTAYFCSFTENGS